MNRSKNYLKDIGLVRTLSCLAVLLYHMNILKGGYLLVCTFFVLSGYLSCVSLFKEDKVSLKKYYLNKLTRLYLPFMIVTFLAVLLVSFFKDINWLNLKPETTSVLLGYNNYWQLSANLDYFARHVSSPFMHFWYMAIILQFDLIFPFIFMLLKKIGKKIKDLPCYILGFLTAIATIYFYISSKNDNIMITYYSTFTRIFSLLFGVFLGFMHHNYREKMPITLKGKFMFYLYILGLIVLSIFVKSNSSLFAIWMILTTIISGRLISYSAKNNDSKMTFFDKIVKQISNISYEIYLVQYPIIFVFEAIDINNTLKIILILILTLLFSIILKFCLNLKKENLKILRFSIFTITIFGSLLGGYEYVIAVDHTAEMKELEKKLEENASLMEERQKAYSEKLKKEQEDWLTTLNNLENDEKALEDIVSKLSIIGIGDSVMLGAVDNLQRQFPNGYFDAATSRTAWVANGILSDLKKRELLGDIIVINLGANGDCPEKCKENIMTTIGERKVFWLNVTNDNKVGVNKRLEALASKYSNLNIIDWNSISKGHREYFISDGIHLTKTGKEVYTKTIFDSIYKVYLDEYNAKKTEILKEYEEQKNRKISFIGNTILTNALDSLQEEFSDSELIVKNDYIFNSVIKDLDEKIENGSLNHKVVLVFDKNSKLTKNDYQTIINKCLDYELYIVALKEEFDFSNYSNVKTIKLHERLNDDHFMPDDIHLNNNGNIELVKILKENLN